MKIETNIPKKNAVIISIIIAWSFYMFSYIARVEPGVIVNNFISEFHITSSTVGFIVSITYIPYVILQVPAGIIVDKLGARMVITLSGILCSLGTIVFGMALNVFGLELGRFLIGVAAASAFICTSKIAGDMFDRSKYSLLMGISMFMGCFGGIFGTAPTAYLVSIIGWRHATFVISCVGALITALAFFFIKEKKIEKKTGERKGEIFKGMKIIASNPKAWILGLYGAITYLPLSTVAELWVVPFMELRYGLNTQTAAFASIAIFIGFALGGIIAAYISEYINSYKKTIIIFTVGLLITLYTALYNDSISFFITLVILFFSGIFAGANTLCFTLAYDVVPDQYAGTSTGFVNGLIMASGIIFLPVLGKLLDFFRNGMVGKNGEPIYSVSVYRSAFLVVIASTIVAIIAAFFINDIKKKRASNS
ncbi:MAG: MFS transporter [Holosporales bacterium]|nr:MFS transporter [Holosporales bacterium]